MIPGIEDVMFSVSFKYDVVAIDSKGKVEPTSIRAAEDNLDSFRDSTIFLYSRLLS